MNIRNLVSKVMKYLHFPYIAESTLEQPVRIYPESTVIGCSVGKYSYCSNRCTFVNCEIGRYCSIAAGVSAGLASHPVSWASTSPAFHICEGRSVPRDMAVLQYDAAPPRTVIGHDVWIGKDVLIKAGVTVGNGAVIGMGSVVTKDVPPYTVVAGNPARMIHLRFPEDLAARMNASRWWEKEPAELKKYSAFMNDPEKFLTALERGENR